MGRVGAFLDAYKKPILIGTTAVVGALLISSIREIVNQYAYTQLVEGKNDDRLYARITEQQAAQLLADRERYKHRQRFSRHNREVAEATRRSEELSDVVLDVPSAHEDRMPHAAYLIPDSNE